MIKKGQWVKVKVNYPKNPRLNGIYEGIVTETGCYRSGFAYFKLTEVKQALPNSRKYTTILETRLVK